MTALSPFFKYLGCKARLGCRYPAPRYETISERFAGAAGYSLNHADHRVILCDSDPKLVRVWQYLIASSPETIMRLPLMEPGQHINTLDVSEDARLFISCCVNTSPFRNVLTHWKNGQNDGLWGAKWREKVASQVDAIKHWKVELGDYSDSPNDECTRFVDPPYFGMQEHYAASRVKPIDYDHLGRWCKSRRGQTIVCEKLGANWLPFKHLADVAAVRNGRGERKCSEAIWTNDNEPLVELVEDKPRGQLVMFG